MGKLKIVFFPGGLLYLSGCLCIYSVFLRYACPKKGRVCDRIPLVIFAVGDLVWKRYLGCMSPLCAPGVCSGGASRSGYWGPSSVRCLSIF